MNSLLKLAYKFEKYAFSINAETIRPQIEKTIYTALKNASGQAQYGIMPFIKMISEDGITLSFDVMRDDGVLSIPTITVSNLELVPGASRQAHAPTVLDKYKPLTIQIKNFLERYPEIYPFKKDGDDVVYENFTLHLIYSWRELSEYAQK